MTNYLVAIDGGGTKTDYILADLEGHEVKRLTHGPTNITSGSLGQAAYNLREGMRLLLEDQRECFLEIVVLAVAGLDTPKDRLAAQKVFAEVLPMEQIGRLVIVNDALALLLNGSPEGPAVALIGGTGASALGRAADGRLAKVSGLDYLLADDGSGYDAGRLALKAAVQSADGRGPSTRLQQLVLEHFAVETVLELKDEIYSPLISKEEIASFAADCVTLAHDGDEVARQIITYCAGQLVLDVVAVARRLGFAEQEFTLVLGGSFLLAIREEFERQLREQLPSAQTVMPETAPVAGSLLIATRLHAGAGEQEFDIFA